MQDAEQYIYEDPGTNGGQPTNEGSLPQGGGTRSLSAAGGNKRDPISSSTTLGETIAGRPVEQITDDSLAGIGNPGEYQADSLGEQPSDTTGGKHTGGPNTGGKGITGTQGTSPMANKDVQSKVDPEVDTSLGMP